MLAVHYQSMTETGRMYFNLSKQAIVPNGTSDRVLITWGRVLESFRIGIHHQWVFCEGPTGLSGIVIIISGSVFRFLVFEWILPDARRNG